LSQTDAFAAYLYFWDSNGTTPGAGGPTPSGTWGVDPYWSPDDEAGNTGTNTTGAWVAGKGAVFAAGDDATGVYTVYVAGPIQAGDIHVDLGQVTFDPVPGTNCSLAIMDPDGLAADRLLSVGHKSPDTLARYNVPITTSTNLVRYKWGTLIFGATNTFTGSFTIEGGLVKCAVPDTLGATNSLVLANNDTTRPDYNPVWQFTPAVFSTGGLDQRLGTLRLAGTDTTVLRMLDLESGSGTLAFDDSSAEDWGAFTLAVTNYAPGTSQLRFGTSSSGLTATQLSQMRFVAFGNLPGVIDSDGYVTPAVPKITAVIPLGGSVQLDWTAVAGWTYRVWSKDILDAASWAFQSDVGAGGDTTSYIDPTPNSNGRFYRVEALPQ